MMPDEAIDLIAYLKELWPKWQEVVTEAQLGVWQAELEKMPDTPVFLKRLKLAADKAFANQSGNWKAPKLAKILDAMRGIPGHDTGEATPQVKHMTGVWIVRMDNRDAKPIMHGRKEIPLGAAIDIANAWAEQHAETYGGEWVVVPQEGQSCVYDPFRARALAKPAYAEKMARGDAAVKARLQAGLPIQLPSMKTIQDALRNTLADDKRARQGVRDQAEEMKGGG